MTIDKYLDRMEDLLDEAISVPLSKGKAMIDVDKMRELLDTVRRNIPQEIKDAKSVVSDRTAIIDDAKAESEEIIQKAEARARQLISEQEISKQADAKASELLLDTQRKCKELERAAAEYAENALKKSEDALLLSLNDVKNTRLALRGNVQNTNGSKKQQ